MGEQTESAARLLAGAHRRRGRGRPPASACSSWRAPTSRTTTSYERGGRARLARPRCGRRFDPEGLLASLARGECEACGGGPAAAVMMAARELGSATESTVVELRDVGRRHRRQGAGRRLHGGGSDGAARPAAGEEAGDGADGGSPVDGRGRRSVRGADRAGERTRSSRLARRAMVADLAGHRPPPLELLTRALETACGAFVTLDKRGAAQGLHRLRAGVQAAPRDGSEMAVQAALHDPRFPAVTADETRRTST